MCLALPLPAQSVQLDFSSIGSSLVTFDRANGTVSFTPDSSGYDFQIGHSSDSGLVGFKGVLQGTFNIGAVTATDVGSIQVEQATVSGTGYLTISDGADSTFTAQLSWDSIVTAGGSGALNGGETINLTDFTYSGPNPQLEALASDREGTATISFQFVPQQSLTQLTSGSGLATTTYSGSLQAIPEPNDYAAVAGLVALAGTVIRKRICQRRTKEAFLSLLTVN